MIAFLSPPVKRHASAPRPQVWLVRLALALIGLGFATIAAATPRDPRWQKVDEAVNHGLPKTAIEALQPIITDALARHAYAEAIRAIVRKIVLENTIQGRRPEDRIERLQAELGSATAPMKPAMEAILAEWYWQYFQQNRWRFSQRTQTATAPGPDIQTWDLARILAEIDRHFTAALADDSQLKATPLHDYADLIDPGTVPETYRPTLFDFLANQALQFYQAGEQGATIAENEFEIPADSPIFARAGDFMQWRPKTTDASAPKLKAIHLYQALLEFHRTDEDRSAFEDADLARLTFGENAAIGDDVDDRYEAALRRFTDETRDDPISARALALLATTLNRAGESKRAHAAAKRGYDAFPDSPGGASCCNVMKEIEAKSARLETEHVWNAPWPTLDVTYRNITKVYFRAVPVDFNDYLARHRWNFGNLDRDQRQSYLQMPAALSWNATVPQTSDFKSRTEKLPAPTTLQPGFYFIFASFDDSFANDNNQVSFASVWVSDLAIVVRSHGHGDRGDGFVLRAQSGEPVTGARIRLWRRNRDGRFDPIAPTETDVDGRFEFSGEQGSLVMLAESGGQAVATPNEIYQYGRRGEEDERTSTVFFTDRAIYRPGQTINYSGIAIRFDQDAGKYSARAGEELTVVFNDANGKEIARATHRTNDYGSFSGVFTAPRDRLLGMMSLRVLEEPGTTAFRVEEYKRPKFQVELEPPAQAAKLGEPVILTGKAVAYTGAAIDGAKVRWRVERGVRLPLWCWWWQPPAVKAIAHGTAVTAADGTFRVEFPAEPDRAVPVKTEPTFVYTLHVDVTDPTGETRSNQRSVRAGYSALVAAVTADEWQTPETAVAFTVKTASLDDDPQPAAGKLVIYALQQPAAVEREPLQRVYEWRMLRGFEPKPDPTNPESWELGAVTVEKTFQTDAKGKETIAIKLPAGIYRAMLETKDRFGHAVTARQTLQVVDPGDAHYRVKLPNYFSAPAWSAEPGRDFTALWGTGYQSGRAFVEIECNGRMLQRYWTTRDRTQELIKEPVTEAMRGGFTVRVTYVRENRAYFNQRVVDVPWSDKQLTVKWERFRSKLLPGQKETWTAVVTGPEAKRAAAEMVATLYDASLDQFTRLNWPESFNVFRHEVFDLNPVFQNTTVSFQNLYNWKPLTLRVASWRYPAFPPELMARADGEIVRLSAFAVNSGAVLGVRGESVRGFFSASTLAGTRIRTAMQDVGNSVSVVDATFAKKATSVGPEEPAAEPSPQVDLTKISARTNLNETAFFFPHLLADDQGVVKLVFTMPEALTEWRFVGFAHDAQLRSGFLTDTTVTAKDLMVQPNPPRFVREGDAIEFTVKVSNQSDQPQNGSVRLTFADAATEKPVDALLGNRVTDQKFEVPAKASRTYSWRIVVPDGIGFLTYKAVAGNAKVSDGEEGFLPVLSRRVLVTESLPLPIRGQTTKHFTFDKLLASGGSSTLRNQSLTVQMTSQPAWYAVMALPYLMEYPYECSEQLFERIYANALARHIANADPKIRRVFDLWKNTSALESPLEKNADLKSLILEETPWVREAQSETGARHNVGLLFDRNRLDEEEARAQQKLAERQLSDGLWAWFPGGSPSEYISLYIMTGFGRLRHLGAEVDVQPAIKSLAALDSAMNEHYREIRRRPNPEQYVPSFLDAQYLYGRSFFLKDQPMAAGNQEMIEFYLRQSRKFWVQVQSRQCQAQLALALQRFGDTETPAAIVRSLKERSITDEELGMYWRDADSWWWYDAPIETQAMMIEAFSEVAHDADSVDACKVWLLKQKQTQAWRTTKATADAVYALLLRGSNLLSSDALVEVSLGGQPIKPEKVEAGTGFYEQKFIRGEIKPAMGNITVTKSDQGVSWGSVSWQYLEDIADVTPHEGTPLKLKKAVFLKETTAKGQVLKPVTGPVSVGDELVVRLELRTDRDMEFVHLKDERGSGTEPVDVLSRYRFQDGLGYYETTRDTATHFFIDYLPRGTHVFEYSTRVQLKGDYQTGIAEIQCMYAPEFNSHSGSIELHVKN